MAKSKSQLKKEEVMIEENVALNGTDTEPEVVEAVKVITGVVGNCSMLYIRKKAVKTSKPEDVVCIVNAGAKLLIDEDKSNKNWYKVTTEDGKEGFCMKEYVTVQ